MLSRQQLEGYDMARGEPTPPSQRVSSLNATVFDGPQLRKLTEGITALLDLMCDVVDTAELGGGQMGLIKHKLEALETEKWSNIRKKYIVDNYQNIKSKLTRDEVHEPSKLLMDFIAVLDSTKDMMDKKLEGVSKNDTQHQVQLKTMKDEFITAKNELTDIRWQHKKDKGLLLAAQSTIEQLNLQIQQKTDKISELQRQSTVQLWEKEKTRVLEKADKVQKELTDENVSLKKTVENINKKLQTIDSQLRMQKMKNEIGRIPSHDDDKQKTEELEKTKMHLHLQGKDLHAVEAEYHSLQKHVCGILSGLEKDFNECLSVPSANGTKQQAVTHPPMTIDPAAVGRVATSLNILTKCRKAAKDGKLGLVRADLPDHYVATDKDVQYKMVKKLSIAYSNPKEAANSDSLSNNHQQTPVISVASLTSEGPSSLPPIAEGALQYSESGPQRKLLVRQDSRVGNRKPIRKSLLQPIYNNGEDSDHPVIVDKSTGFVDMITVLKNFPHMTKPYILDQWEQFNRYDKDGDGTLDLPEMMQAMNCIVGQEFNAKQIKEAMSEVDVDGSNTIDFYEYLLVSDMLLHKEGRAEVFKSAVVRENNRSVSKTCVLQ